MFTPGDRTKLLAYLAKKKASPSPTLLSSCHHAKANTSLIVSPRQRLSSQLVARGNKSDDAIKRVLPSASLIADNNNQPNGQQHKKNKKKKSSGDKNEFSMQTDDHLELSKSSGQEARKNKKKALKDPTVSTMKSQPMSPVSKKRTLDHHRQQSQFEQSLMQDVKSMLADFKKNSHFRVDDYLDADEEEEDLEVENFPKKKKKSKNDNDDPEEVAKRSTELGQKARQTLAASMFRSLNEFLYSHDSNQTRREFTANKFKLYHQAYDQFMDGWPLKPIDFLIDVLKVC